MFVQVNDNTPKAWRIALVVEGLQAHQPIPVVVGLVDTAAGGVLVALQVGGDSPVILALHDANQLALNLTETTAERLKVTGERRADGGP